MTTTPIEALRRLVEAIDAKKAIKAAILRERSAIAVRGEREEADWRMEAALGNARAVLAAHDAAQVAGEAPQWLVELCMVTEAVTPTADLRATVKELIDWHVNWALYNAAHPPQPEPVKVPAGWIVHAKVNIPADEPGQRIVGYRVSLAASEIPLAIDELPDWHHPNAARIKPETSHD